MNTKKLAACRWGLIRFDSGARFFAIFRNGGALWCAVWYSFSMISPVIMLY